jgi:ribosomal protein S27E
MAHRQDIKPLFKFTTHTHSRKAQDIEEGYSDQEAEPSGKPPKMKTIKVGCPDCAQHIDTMYVEDGESRPRQSEVACSGCGAAWNVETAVADGGNQIAVGYERR